MKKLNLVEIAKDPDVHMQLNMFGFEDFCGACMHFRESYQDSGDSECPHIGKVHTYTDYKYEVHCDKFWD